MQCHPPRVRLWHSIMPALMTVSTFGGLFGAALFMVSELLTNFQTSELVKLLLFAIGCLISFMLMLIFVRWDQDRWYWFLDGDKLIGGKRKDKVFLLSSIAAIVPGLPEKANPLVAPNKYLHPNLWNAVMIDRKLALVLKFTDGSFMPFHVHKCVDGSSLMAELVARLAERVDSNYEWTQREVKALRSPDWNRLVKQRV